ncbi:MAG: hypothetical protein IM638_00160 [Bacteroidetes bacterium]|nr:hypothetical protein [Bacteroidota bacterium]
MKHILLTLVLPALLLAGCSAPVEIKQPATTRQPEQVAEIAPAPQPAPVAAPEKITPKIKSNRRKPRRYKPALVFTPNVLEKQEWKVNPFRDTVIQGKYGTQLRIPASAFCFADGSEVKTPVEVSLREAVRPEDIVLAGLTTLHNGRVLESGGMIEITARSNGRELKLNRNAAVDVEIPAAAKQAGMSVFEGKISNGLMNWVNPVKIDQESENPSIQSRDEYDSSSDDLTPNPIAIYIGEDTVFLREGDDTLIYRPEKIRQYYRSLIPNGGRTTGAGNVILEGNFNTNYLVSDPSQSYVFSMKKLGWANIDRLSNDPRTRQVDFVTDLEDKKLYNSVNITLVFPGKNIFLPGYQKADGTYGFSHGDYEPMQLPVGEEAVLVVTAQKESQSYFASEKLIIQPQQKIVLAAKPASEEEIKQKLAAAL